MTRLSVDANIATDVDLLGKTVTDFQNKIIIGRNTIRGTLNHVENFTAFSGDPALQSGNYIVIHAEVPEVEDATITVKVTNPVTLDSDGIAILRIADKNSQTITVVASKDGYESVTKVFRLNQLVCRTD